MLPDGMHVGFSPSILIILWMLFKKCILYGLKLIYWSCLGRVTNIPQGMVTDQFGMIGLLTFIRAAETDPGMVHLALGSDLTTLGLNLNSPE